MKAIYRFLSGTVWVIVFIGAWAYCTKEYGFLLGFGLGWLPAALSATLAALLWPLAILAGAGIGGVIAYESHFKKPTAQAQPQPVAETQAAPQTIQQPPKQYKPQAASEQGWEDAKKPSQPPPQQGLNTSFEALNQSFWTAYRNGDRDIGYRTGTELYSRLEEGLSKATAAGDVQAVNEINLLLSQLEDALSKLQSGGRPTP